MIFHGRQNFNAQPWAPPGCRAIALEHPYPLYHGNHDKTIQSTLVKQKITKNVTASTMYVMDTKKNWICKGVTFLYHSKDPTIGEHYLYSWFFFEMIKLNKGKARETSKYLKALEQLHGLPHLMHWMHQPHHTCPPAQALPRQEHKIISNKPD